MGYNGTDVVRMSDLELFERDLTELIEDLDAFGNHLCDIGGI